MTYEGSTHHYTYDAEGNIVQADSGSTGTYVYDALNHRVQGMTSGNKAIEFVFDVAGRITSYWTPVTTAVQGNIYADNTQIAFRAGDGNTYFNHKNWLNTDRVHTDLNGAAAAVYTSLPWGDNSTDTVYESDGGWDFSRFGDIDYDQESNTYHAPFRQYSQAQARWMSPDPYDGSYDASNPQSFNRYAYVLNNPMSDIDPDGEDTSQGLCYLTASSCGAGGGGGGVGGGGTGIGQMQMASNTMWPSSTSEVFIVPTDGETPPHMETQTTSLVSSMSPWLFLTSWVPGGGGGSGGAAPNNPSPCVQSFSNAMALDYSQPIYNGQTTQQHIQSRHMSGVGKQNVSTYWTQDFSAVMHLNFWTFLLGDQTVDSRGMTFELTFPNLRALLTPGSGLQNGIGYDKNGNDTLTNRLATMPDCKTVVTSYPIQ